MEKNQEHCVIYITCRDRDEAEKIAEFLLLKRLVACTNIFPISSMFWWKGEIDKTEEFVLIAKTIKSQYPKVEKAAKTMHSYEVPCIISFNVEQGSEEYLDWISEETSVGKIKAQKGKKKKK